MKKQLGFNLIELAITLAIVGILATFIVANYSTYVKKGRRVDAVDSILAIALAEERYRANNPQYGNLDAVWGGRTTSADGYYTLSISNISATSFTIAATGVGGQATDKEGNVNCNVLTYQVINGMKSELPADCWPR